MSRIESTGSYLPESIISNEFFSKMDILPKSRDTVSDDHENATSITDFFSGFNERRHASPDETGVFMATSAAKRALENSQYEAKDIDLIIGAIVPSSHLYGDELNLVQNEIGAWNAAVLPVNTACSSFLSALNVADSMIRSGKNKRVLVVIVANWVNHGLNETQPSYFFAGDGAGALVLDDQDESLIDIVEINKSTPAVFDSMILKNPLFTDDKEYFTVEPPREISLAKDLILFPISVAQTLLERNKSVNIDKIIFHQAGIKMMSMWAKKLGLDESKIRHTIDLYGNMTVANIPVSLDHWFKNGDIKRGQNILFFSPAAGGHYIAILWTF